MVRPTLDEQHAPRRRRLRGKERTVCVKCGSVDPDLQRRCARVGIPEELAKSEHTREGELG